MLLERDDREIKVAALRASGKEVARNAGASVHDMGDGVALFEFHSPANAIDNDVFEMIEKALDLLDSDFDALVIGHDGERFCVGANLFMVAMAVQSGNLDDLKAMHKHSQDMMQAIRFAPKPVVIAAHNMALGGGAETIMAGARVVAHAELYAGLVEVGVGLIPGWGGCKEMVRRVVNPVMASHPNADALPHLQKVFEQIALAKVSESAKQAREMGILGCLRPDRAQPRSSARRGQARSAAHGGEFHADSSRQGLRRRTRCLRRAADRRRGLHRRRLRQRTRRADRAQAGLCADGRRDQRAGLGR